MTEVLFVTKKRLCLNTQPDFVRQKKKKNIYVHTFTPLRFITTPGAHDHA